MKSPIGLLSLLLALFAFTTAARADTIYNVNGTFLGGGTLNGTIDYNGATFDAGDVLATIAGQTFEFTTGAIAPVAGYPVTAIWAEDFNAFGVGYLDLFLNVGSLANFSGATLCSLSAPCGTIFNTTNFNLDHNPLLADPLVSGSITPLTVTPEPSSILLLGTGLIGIAFVAKKRYLQV